MPCSWMRKHYNLLLIVIFMEIPIATLNELTDVDAYRNITFMEPILDHALNGHVIANRTVDTQDQCQIECFLIAECTSLNFITSPHATPNCQLSSSTYDINPNSLKPTPRYSYQGSKNGCFKGACKAENKVCQSGFGRLGYRCICVKCLSGKQCKKYNDDTVLFFPKTESVDQYVAMKKTLSESIEELTISFWVQTNRSDEGINPAPLSIISKENVNEINMYFEKNEHLMVDFQGTNSILKVNASEIFDGHWHHISLTWSMRSAQHIIIYVDGNKKDPEEAESPHKHRTLRTKLRIVLGQEQDDYTSGNYDPGQSYQGNITSFNMWDKVFEGKDILAINIAKQGPFGQEGNLIKWSELVPFKSNSVKFHCGLPMEDFTVYNNTQVLTAQ